MITPSTRLSDIVFKNVQLINVISCFGIKLGLAEKTIKVICEENNINAKFFLVILNTYNDNNYFPNINEIDVNLLIDYLTKTHLYYLNFIIPRIEKLFILLQKSLPNEKTIKHIKKYFDDYKDELKNHIEFEESSLFPLIIDLMTGKEKRTKISNTSFKRLKLEHSNVEDKLFDLKTILVRFLPDNADEQLVFDLLFTIAWFEKNHLNHASFEDKILVPKLKYLLIRSYKHK